MYRATLIKGKTYDIGPYRFNIKEFSTVSQIVTSEIAKRLEQTKRFKIVKIGEPEPVTKEIVKSEVIKPEMVKPEIIEPKTVESEIFVLIDWIEEATGYGNIAKKLLKKYSGTIKYVQKGPEFKDNLDLKDVPAESYVIQLTTPNCFRDLSNAKKRIGFTMFETTKIPPDWAKICNKTLDILIVPSGENKKIFKNCGVEIPIKVIPLWVDDCYKYYDRPKRKIFTFLFVGGVDDHNRKGWYELQKAFKLEFKKEKDVRLIFKCLFINIHNEMALQIMEDDRISFVKEKLKNKELYELYKKADCFVFPTHGEGFGLPPLEAMATGLPTIVTDWMGCKEFVDNKICYPLKVDKLEEALFPDTYGDVGNWAYISIKELRRQMRYVYEHQKEARQKGKLAAKVVNKKYRFKHFTEALEKTVKPSGIKIGFVPHQSISRKNIAAGTRIRVLNIARHLENCIISENYEELKNCQVVILQARWQKEDIMLAKKLYEDGVKLIFDTTDPHWDTENFDFTGRKRKAFDQILRFVSLMTFPTSNLRKSFLEYRQDKEIAIIPDSIDLAKHDKTKIHTEKKQYTIVWFGCRVNIASLDLAREDLERLGKEFNLRLVALYDQGYKKEQRDMKDKEDTVWKVEPYENLGLEIREWSDEATIEAILEGDVVLNPKFTNWKEYKSSNKSRKGLALGVPAVEKDYYKEIKRYLLSAKLRNKIGKAGKKFVKKYDSKVIATKLTKICNEMVSRKLSKKKKRIAVVTAIAGGFDHLHEPEFKDDNVDYFAFTDFGTKSNVWKVIPIGYSHFRESRMIAKKYKILIHKFVDYDYILWVDGSLVLKGNITNFVNKFLGNGVDIALYSHRYRNCPYEEHIASAQNTQHAKGEPISIRRNQIRRYEAEGLPKKFGLYECTLILRKNNKKVRNFNEQWWDEILFGSSSDQVPFMYILWKNPDIKVNAIAPGDAHNNEIAYYVEHGRDKYV